jgi:SAM-dependent methyltransferase
MSVDAGGLRRHAAASSFAGVANPHRMGPLGDGAVVVDIGCGAGMDLLLAARSVGPRGRAIGVDMTDVMAEKARGAKRASRMSRYGWVTPWPSPSTTRASTS